MNENLKLFFDQISIPLHLCLFCQDNDNKMDWVILPCAHMYCSSCAVSTLQGTCSNLGRDAAECGVCRYVFSTAHVRRLGSRPLVANALIPIDGTFSEILAPAPNDLLAGVGPAVVTEDLIPPFAPRNEPNIVPTMTDQEIEHQFMVELHGVRKNIVVFSMFYDRDLNQQMITDENINHIMNLI